MKVLHRSDGVYFAGPNMQDDRVNHTASETTETLETFSEGEQQPQQMKELNDQPRNGTRTLESFLASAH